MKLVVTGAAGFVGGHLARAAAARGDEVLPLVRAPAAGDPPGARALDEVLRTPSRLDGATALIHAAAVRHRYGVDVGAYQASNVDLVEALMRAAAGRVGRFVYVSSVGVYGWPPNLPVTEQHPFAPVTLYSRTKVEAEARVRRLAPELGMSWTIVRPTIVYGAGDRNGMMDKMARMIAARRYRVVGNGRNVLHHTHVDDVVEGTLAAATHPAAAGDDFILAGPETITLEELSRLVARALGVRLPRLHVPLRVARGVASVIDLAARRGVAFTRREPPINHEKLDVMTLPIAFDSGKAMKSFGYRPRVRYEDGVPRSVGREAI